MRSMTSSEKYSKDLFKIGSGTLITESAGSQIRHRRTLGLQYIENLMSIFNRSQSKRLFNGLVMTYCNHFVDNRPSTAINPI